MKYDVIIVMLVIVANMWAQQTRPNALLIGLHI